MPRCRVLPGLCLLLLAVPGGWAQPRLLDAGTAISFTLAQPGPVEVAIYSLGGQRVRTLLKGVQPAGTSHWWWDGADDHGRILASGVYLYRLQSADGTASRRLLLLK